MNWCEEFNFKNATFNKVTTTKYIKFESVFLFTRFYTVNFIIIVVQLHELNSFVIKLLN